MQLNLTRFNFSDKSSIGRIFVDGVDRFSSLEPTMREVPNQPVSTWKVAGKTAIGVGTYEIDMVHSPRFGFKTPRLIGVDGFEAIEIHVGNWPQNTEGCILAGLTAGTDFIGRSKEACQKLYAEIQAARDKGEKVFITITNHRS